MAYVMKCPYCKKYGNTLIAEVKTKSGYIRRERQCDHCEEIFFTREMHFDFDKPKAKKKKKGAK